MRILNPILCMILVICVVSLFTKSKEPRSRVDVSVQKNVQSNYDKTEGFDLELLQPLLKETSDPEQLEKKINDKNGPNNLDLDEDGHIDYIYVDKVNLQSDKKRGLRLYTKLKDGQGKEVEEEIATIEIKKVVSSTQESSYEANVYGRGHYYNGYHYHYPRFSVGDYLLMRWLWGPSYYGWYRPYGYYGWYRPSYYYRPVVTRTRYVRQTTQLRSSKTSQVNKKVPGTSTRKANATNANKKYGFKSATSGSGYKTGSSNKYKSSSSSKKSSAFGRSSTGSRSRSYSRFSRSSFSGGK